ncbi:hypothetical protein, partial [Thalassolituus pacificus]
ILQEQNEQPQAGPKGEGQDARSLTAQKARSWGRPAGKGISSPGRQQALMLKNAVFVSYGVD